MARVDVISGVERRRRWSTDQKRAIVAAAFSPGAVVNEVTRRADVSRANPDPLGGLDRMGTLQRQRRDDFCETINFVQHPKKKHRVALYSWAG
jgi:hypothetical protein